MPQPKHNLVPAGSITLNVGIGVPCPRLRTATLMSLKIKLHQDMLATLRTPHKEKAGVQVQYVGCQNAVSTSCQLNADSPPHMGVVFSFTFQLCTLTCSPILH